MNVPQDKNSLLSHFYLNLRLCYYCFRKQKEIYAITIFSTKLSMFEMYKYMSNIFSTLSFQWMRFRKAIIWIGKYIEYFKNIKTISKVVHSKNSIFQDVKPPEAIINKIKCGLPLYYFQEFSPETKYDMHALI